MKGLCVIDDVDEEIISTLLLRLKEDKPLFLGEEETSSENLDSRCSIFPRNKIGKHPIARRTYRIIQAPTFEDSDEYLYSEEDGVKVFSKATKKVLWTWYGQHMNVVGKAYPDNNEKRQLCQNTGLSLTQVNNFMSNARRRPKTSQRNVKKFSL